MTERWVKMVKKAAMSRVSETDPNMRVQYLYVPQVVTLLARPHREIMKQVKDLVGQHLYLDAANDWHAGSNDACKKILAALAKQGGGNK